MARSSKQSTRTAAITYSLDPEDRQNVLVSKAMNLAEKQLDDGTASSQVICSFLKLGTTNAQLERERLINENELMKAKRMQLEKQANSEELYKEAISAMRMYSGNGDDDEYDPDDY